MKTLSHTVHSLQTRWATNKDLTCLLRRWGEPGCKASDQFMTETLHCSKGLWHIMNRICFTLRHHPLRCKDCLPIKVFFFLRCYLSSQKHPPCACDSFGQNLGILYPQPQPHSGGWAPCWTPQLAPWHKLIFLPFVYTCWVISPIYVAFHKFTMDLRSLSAWLPPISDVLAHQLLKSQVYN